MPFLDMRTVFACFVLASLVCIAAVARQWWFYRRRFKGLGLWLAGSALQLPGLLLIAFRGSVPDLVSMTGGNAVIVGGFVLLLAGLRAFFGLGGGAGIDWAAFAAFTAAHAWFAAARPNLRAREILFGAAMIFVCARAFRILARLGRPRRALAAGTTGVLVAGGLAGLARLAVDLAFPAGNDFLADPSYDSVFMVFGLAFCVALTFAIVSMVGRRVFLEQESLIEERIRAEETLKASEEKFVKAFKASPDAIAISRLDDGRIVEVNEVFCRIMGYSRDEALGSPPIDVWGDRNRRRELVDELARYTIVRDREIAFIGKAGRTIRANYSGCLIELRGETHIVSVIRDLSDRERSAVILRVRLELREFSVGHTAEELMVRALDEIEKITDSRIGFYHSVDEDRGTVSLQVWSSRTLREFCKAEGSGSHYAIEGAGVWADGIRERRAVIQNDYAALPGRKGMPEGHAVVRRELVAPTFRGGKIVAIVGVGNKPSDYDEDDVAIVSYIADLVWSIVVQKRSDERIIALNHQLEELAMTDDLTGMPNRRAFFAIAERELQRATRYSSPLSFIMMDVDHFKRINDTYGHAAGDDVLRTVAGVLRRGVRDVDIAARLGGEEFGVLMPNTRISDAILSAERIRAAVSRTACDYLGEELRVTVSMGVAAMTKESASLDSIMRTADAAMYRAKETGRDRVEQG